MGSARCTITLKHEPNRLAIYDLQAIMCSRYQRLCLKKRLGGACPSCFRQCSGSACAFGNGDAAGYGAPDIKHVASFRPSDAKYVAGYSPMATDVLP